MKSSTGRTVAVRYLSDRNHGKQRNDYYTGSEAIELPTVEELRNIITEHISGRKSHSLTLKAGGANRNPKDPFVKKIGKDLVLKRLEAKPALVLPLKTIRLPMNDLSVNVIFNFGGYVFGLTNTKVQYLGYDFYS